MLVRHSLVYIATNLVAGLFGFATTLILTRLISPAEYGVFGLGNTLVYFAVAALFDWQATTYMRFIQATGTDRARMTGVFVGLFLAAVLLSLGLALPFALLAPASIGGGDLAWYVLPCLWVFAWFQFIVRVHTANFHPGRVMAMNLVRGAAGLVAAVAVAWATGRGDYVLLASFAGAALGAMVRMGAVMHFRLPWRERALVVQAMGFGLPMALAFVISGLSPVVNRMLLAEFGSLSALGYYSVGAVLVQNTIGLMAGGVGAAAYTLAVHTLETDEKRRADAQLAANFVLLLALLLPSAVGLALVAPALVPFLVGREFVGPAVELTPWVAAAAFVGCMRAHYVDTGFHLAKRTGLLTCLLAAMAALEIGLGIVLIPRFGYMGPAYANLAAMCTGWIVCFAVARRVHPMTLPLAEAAKVIAATLAMAFAVKSVPLGHDALGLALPIAAGVVVYGVLVLATNVLGLRQAAFAAVTRRVRRQPT